MTTEEVERWSAFKAWIYSLFNRDPMSNRVVVRLLGLGEDDSLLDIGCGPGAALEHAVEAGVQVSGIDPSPSMVTRAARRVPEADVKVASAEDIPFPDGSFTAAMNISSFHHWADRDAGLREVLRVLTPAGRLAIVEGVLKPEREGHGLNPTDVELLTARLEELGYTDTSVDRLKVGWTRKFFVISAARPQV